MATVKEPGRMTDKELLDAYGFFVGLGPVMRGEFPERRCVEIAYQLGRRAGADGGRIYMDMRTAWGKGINR